MHHQQGAVRSVRLLAFCCLTALAVACDRTSAEDHVDRAAQHMDSGRHNAAVLELRNALQKEPELAQARLRLGHVLHALGDHAGAVTEFERAERFGEESPELVELLLQARSMTGDAREARAVIAALGERDLSDAPSQQAALARAHMTLNELEAAREQLQELTTAHPEAVEGHRLLARLARGQGQLDAALRHLEPALTLPDPTGETHVLQGELLLALEQIDAALEAFQVARDQAPAGSVMDIAARIGSARALVTQQRFEEAAPLVDDLLSDRPGILSVVYLRGLIQLHREDLAAAQRSLEQVLSADPDHLGSRYFRAVIAMREGRNERARDDLERLLARMPDNLAARLLLASVYTDEERFDRAIQVLEAGQAVADTSGHAAYQAALAQAYASAGRDEDAAAALEAAASAAPDPDALRMRMGLAQLAAGNVGLAEQQLLKVSTAGQDSAMTDALLVILQLEQGRLDEAQQSAQRYVERHPEDAVAHNLKGAVSMARNDLAAAAEAFERALELDPELASARKNLAGARFRAGDTDAALTLLAELVAADDSDLEARRLLVRMAREAGELELAIQHQQSLLQAAPEAEAERLELAALLLQQGDSARAQDLLAEAGPDAQASDSLLRARVATAMHAGDLPRAQQALDAYVLRHPGNREAINTLAEVHLRQGDQDAARHWYAQSLELADDQVLVLNNLAWLYGQIGHEDAIPLARRAHALAPEVAAVQDTLGWLLLQQGDVEEGLALLASAAERAPNDAQIQYHYAVALERSGAAGEAAERLRHALQLGSFDEADEARALLARLDG